jgi:hypothetical protein
MGTGWRLQVHFARQIVSFMVDIIDLDGILRYMFSVFILFMQNGRFRFAFWKQRNWNHLKSKRFFVSPVPRAGSRLRKPFDASKTYKVHQAGPSGVAPVVPVPQALLKRWKVPWRWGWINLNQHLWNLWIFHDFSIFWGMKIHKSHDFVAEG